MRAQSGMFQPFSGAILFYKTWQEELMSQALIEPHRSAMRLCVAFLFSALLDSQFTLHGRNLAATSPKRCVLLVVGRSGLVSVIMGFMARLWHEFLVCFVKQQFITYY